MLVTNEAPYISIRFTSVDGDSFEVWNGDLGGDVISVNTEKSLVDASGQFSITMVARKNYIDFFQNFNFANSKEATPWDIFRPTALVDIYINGQEVMLGIIDQMSKTVVFQDNKPQRSITIIGRDFGSFLIDHAIWYDNKLTNGRKYNFALVGGVAALGAIGSESPGKVMMEVFNKWFTRVINQKLPGYDNVFRFADGSYIHDKLIGVSEVVNNYEVRADNAVEDSEGNTETTEGELLANVQGPGAMSEITYGNYYPIQFSMWNFQGDLYNFLKTFASSPFNELYVETGGKDVVLGHARTGSGDDLSTWRDVSFNAGEGKNIQLSDSSTPKGGRRTFRMTEGKAYIVFRPSPFDDEDIPNGITDQMDSLLRMQDLIEHSVNDQQIAEKTISVGRNNIPSFYHVTPAGGLLTANASKMFNPAEYDERALRRYGYNPMQVQLDAFDIATKNFKEGGIEDVAAKFQKKLKGWFQVSDKLLTGTMTIKGNANIRVGERISYDRLNGKIEDEYEEGKYYIVGVSQKYTYGNSYKTSLQLDRGVSKKMMGLS